MASYSHVIQTIIELDLVTRRLRVEASKGKAADYNGSSEGEEDEEWSPKFVQEAISSSQESLKSSETTTEDPFLVEKAKEKFWGRIAVISLGVRPGSVLKTASTWYCQKARGP